MYYGVSGQNWMMEGWPTASLSVPLYRTRVTTNRNYSAANAKRNCIARHAAPLPVARAHEYHASHDHRPARVERAALARNTIDGLVVMRSVVIPNNFPVRGSVRPAPSAPKARVSRPFPA